MTLDISSEKFITKEAEIYLHIGRLLKKERTQEAQDRVLQVLNMDISLEEIIKKINELDKIEGLKAGPAGLKTGDAETVIINKNIVQSATVRKNILGIKAPLKKLHYLKYLFSEWLNIRRYAYNTPIIRPRFFSFKINMTTIQWEVVQKDAALVLHQLNIVLENGWVVLYKQEYNRLMLLKKLCDEIQLCKINYFLDEEYARGKTSPVELYFLACHYRQDYPDKILESIAFVYKYLKKSADKIRNALFFANKLLFPAKDIYSLYNLVLAFNMIKYRKFLGLYDLIQEMPGGVISNFDFECSENIRPKIAAYISEKEMRLEQLMADKREMNKIGLFIDRPSGAGTDAHGGEYNTLVRFYDMETGPSRQKFFLDKDNLYILSGNIIKRFLSEFEVFLNGRFKIEKWGEIQPFTPEFFAGDIGRMQSLLKSYSSMNLAFLHFNLARMSELKKSRNYGNASREEVEIIRFIDELTALILEIGKKIGHLTIACQADPLGTDQDKIYPMDLSVLSKNPIPIPYGDKKILLPGFLFEQGFIIALHSIASLCYETGRFLQNEEIVSYSLNERKADEEILKIKQTLERIADPVVFSRIRKTYPLWK